MRLAMAVAAEWFVEIVADPGRQRDVPSPPELGERAGNIGRIEILPQPEAEHAGEPDRHVGVAGKIEIDLHRKAGEAEPGVARTQARRIGGKDAVDEGAEWIGDQKLAPDASRESAGNRPPKSLHSTSRGFAIWSRIS